MCQTRQHGRQAITAAYAGDPGSWELSPEWMGSQGGSWGRDDGTVIFSAPSHFGNGQVCVTSHPASHVGGGRAGQDPQGNEQEYREEWRVLRFNEHTRQSVARVRVWPDGRQEADPHCLAFEYLKTLAATVAGALAHFPLAFDGILQRSGDGDDETRLRVLCIGLGGGSLPLFLSHHLPGSQIDIAELDPVVIEAATHSMAFPSDREGLTLHNTDGVELVGQWAQEGRQADLVIIDAFDGDDSVPPAFIAEGSPFAEDLAQVLDGSHGALVMNMHSGPKLAIPSRLQRRAAGLPDPGFDPAGDKGREVVRISRVFRDAILWPTAGAAMASLGIAFTVVCPKQQNAAMVVARGLGGDYAPLVANRVAGELFEAAASRFAEAAGFRFEARGRAAAWLTPVDALQ